MTTRYWIKVRKPGTKTFTFLTPRGDTSRLRVHARLYTHDAVDRALTTLMALNPTLEFKRVPIRFNKRLISTGHSL